MEIVIIFFIFDNKKKSINYNTIDEFQYCEDIEDFQKLGKSNDMITTKAQKDHSKFEIQYLKFEIRKSIS